MNRRTLKQFISFGLVGGCNTVLNLLIFWFCIHHGLDYLLANVVGFIITVAISYILNNMITFREKTPFLQWSLIALCKVYLSYFSTGIVLNSILLCFWKEIVGVDLFVAPILNLFLTIPLNFFINKHWAYRS